MIIDCHGHFTTAPKELQAFRDEQIEGLKHPEQARRNRPLTITDDRSRYLLACEGLESTKSKFAFSIFERTFREFGLPAAIGAKVGCPDRTVWAVDGDGCFQMTAQELVTASVERIPIKVAVLNNSYLGMVRQWQEMFYEERYSEVYLSPELPDFVKWAEAMGCVGIRVESPEEVEPAIALANSINDRSVVIEFRVDAGEKVFPMVPAGYGNDDVLLHPNQNERREFLR